MKLKWFAIITAVSITVATSCIADARFYVANLSPAPARIEFSAQCRPCLTPAIIAVVDLKRAREWMYYESHQRPAPVEVRGRTDSLLTYSLVLPPGEAVLLFERTVDGSLIGAAKADAERIFADVSIKVEASTDTVAYNSRDIGDVLRRWHKYIYVIEVK